jgi:hypothetical protein
MGELVKVACASCGAPISIPPDVRFITCSHCGSSLALEMSGGAAWTKVREHLQAIEATTAKTAEASEKIAAELQRQRDEKEQEAHAERLRCLAGCVIPLLVVLGCWIVYHLHR